MPNNNSDTILNQIASKLEKANSNLSKKRAELFDLEQTCLRLERAQTALTDELILPTKHHNKPSITKQIYEYVCSNPGIRGADIQKGLNIADNTVYMMLASLVRQHKITKNKEKRYYPISDANRLLTKADD